MDEQNLNSAFNLPLEPTHMEIAERAYGIYVESGCKAGQCQQNWSDARNILQQERQALIAAQEIRFDKPSVIQAPAGTAAKPLRRNFLKND